MCVCLCMWRSEDSLGCHSLEPIYRFHCPGIPKVGLASCQQAPEDCLCLPSHCWVTSAHTMSSGDSTWVHMLASQLFYRQLWTVLLSGLSGVCCGRHLAVSS